MNTNIFQLSKITFTMKNGFLLIVGLLLVACSDFAKKDQLVKITALQKKISALEGQVTKNKIAKISEIKLATSEVELRIKKNLYLDTINLELGKKMDDYKRMRRSFMPLAKSYSQLIKGIREERLALKNLKLDVQNGEGERGKYDEYIAFEANKINQLMTLLEAYISYKDETMKTYFRLHPSLDSLSRTLQKV